LKIGEYEIAGIALKNASRWIGYIKNIPNINYFPEQVGHDGSLPRFVPKPLAWCAAEFMKAERMYFEMTNRISFYSTSHFVFNLYKPKLTLNFALN
jgi:hypothetical protein